MFKKYLQLAIRNILKNNVYSVINILGLVTGLTASILISLWVYDEISFDKFNQNANDIYRVIISHDDGVVFKSTKSPGSPLWLSSKIMDEIPDVINAANVTVVPQISFNYKNNAFNENSGLLADSPLFSVFTFKLLKGNPQKVLSAPSNIVLTEKMAEKYFGKEDPLGKIVTMNGKIPLTVSGVMADVPKNSHLQFDFVLPIKIADKLGIDVSPANYLFITYFQLRHGTNVNKIEKEVNTVFKKNVSRVEGVNISESLYLQPLTSIHLSKDIKYDPAVLGDITYVYIFSSLALLILFIACMNFVNLATARSSMRFKEVGLRKSIGANKLQIFYQFFFEFLLLILVSVVLALIVVKAVLPAFSQISGKLLFLKITDLRILLGLLGIVIITAISSIAYPSIFLSSLSPLKSLNKVAGRSKRNVFRQSLVIIQFTLSIGLIISTLMVGKQISYMKNKDIGINKEGLIYIPINEKVANNYLAFKNSLLRYPGISSVSVEDCLPTTNGISMSTVANGWEGKIRGEDFLINFMEVDYDYFKTMGIELVAGRTFSRDFGTDNNAFILNEEAMKQMHLEDPIGTQYFLGGNDWREGQIVGVIKNTNFKSLQHKIVPQIFVLINEQGLASAIGKGIIFIRINRDNISRTLTSIQSEWEKISNDQPFEYHFYDETVNSLYQAETKANSIINYFAGFAIFVSCLGLFGLSLFVIEHKTKEIGIRKVNGAKVSEILALLNQDYIKWVVIAFISATSITYYAMYKWLENFAYKTELSWWIFALSGLLALGIALLTVSWQSWRAATRNPVESLRYE